MKAILFVFLMTISSICHAQDNSPQEQTDPSKNYVFLKNGEAIEFYRVSSVHKGNLKLQLKKAGENYFENFKNYKKIPVTTVERISLSEEQHTFTNRKNETYVFTTGKIVKLKKKEVFAIELVSGECSLYYHSFINNNGSANGDNYYFIVKRKGEEKTTVLHGNTGISPKFRRAGSKYFADCPEIVQKIKESETKAKSQYLIPELTRIVTSYNANCAAPAKAK